MATGTVVSLESKEDVSTGAKQFSGDFSLVESLPPFFAFYMEQNHDDFRNHLDSSKLCMFANVDLIEMHQCMFRND